MYEQPNWSWMPREIAVRGSDREFVPTWKTKPSWFLLAEVDLMILAETQRYMAERMGAKIRRHGVDHGPTHSAPDAVIGVILEAAHATS